MISVGIAVVSVVLGIIISYLANVAPAGAIVLTSVAIFLCTIVTREIRKSIRSGKITSRNLHKIYFIRSKHIFQSIANMLVYSVGFGKNCMRSAYDLPISIPSV